MVLAAEGRKANDSHADCYQYFCVPEYGTANGRLHFHAVHFMRTLPTGSVDPNFGRRVRNRRQLNSLQNTWPYGYSMFFFQAEDGIRFPLVTGFQTCALPILLVAFAGFTVAAGLSALYLWQERRLKRRETTILRVRAPGLARLDELAARTIAIALPALTLGIDRKSVV